MTTTKFGDDERRAVIERIENQKHITLKAVGQKRIFLRGSDGLYYCIIGGRGDWHAIPKDVIAQERHSSGSVCLVIARWLKPKIEIYEGLLKPLVDSKGLLSSTKQGGIQFDLNIPTDGILSIVQMPSAKFLKVDEVDPPSISVWRTLSEEQRRALLDLLPKPDQK